MNFFLIMTSLFLGLITSKTAKAETQYQYEIHWNCKPTESEELNQPLSWYYLKKINSLSYSIYSDQIDKSRIEIDWDFFDKNQGEVENYKTPFKVDNQYFLDELQLLKPRTEKKGELWTYISAVFFQPLSIETPETAGPVPSGTFQAQASLIILSTSREEPGHPNKSHVGNIGLNCEVQTHLK